MKYLAILKDSLLEAVDTKVIYVTLGMSALFLLIVATLKLEPNPPETGLQRLTERFLDGSIQVEVPVLGKIKAGDSLAEYRIADLRESGDPSRPWDAEYRFVLEAKDVQPSGFRFTVLRELMRQEEEHARQSESSRKTRWQQLEQEIQAEARRLANSAEIRNLNPDARQQKFLEEINKFILGRLQQELDGVSQAERENFLKQQLENQGNWTVHEIRQTDGERIKMKVRLAVPDGEDVRFRSEEVEGDRFRYEVTMKSRAGTYRLWPHRGSLFFGGYTFSEETRPGPMVYELQGWILNTFGAAAIILLSCIITSFFIPNMLRKGTVDLLLAKPIRRWALLSYKYVGGLTFMFINTAVIVVGFWLVMGLRAGIWEPAMLLSILVLTFEFALFYAVSTLLAVLTRSPVVSILGCILLWALLLPVGLAYWFAGRPASTDSGERPWHVTAINVVHAVLPRYKDLDVLGEKTLYLAMHDPSPAQQKAKEEEYRAYYWDETILVNGIWIALFLGLACWRFQVRDY